MTLPDSGMLLHASRIVVPREPKSAIDVSAPLRPLRPLAGFSAMKPEDVVRPR